MRQMICKSLLMIAVTSGLRLACAMTSFEAAESVWPKGLEKEMNTLVSFRSGFDLEADEKPVLKLVAWYSYRVTLNGTFVAFGPARGPKGFFRPDEIDLSKMAKTGRNELVVEVAGYNVPNFYLMEQAPFFKAEIVVNGSVRAASRVADGDFSATFSPRIRKTVRYSFQRTFAECYRLPGGTAAPLALARAPEPALIDRVVPYPDYEVTPLEIRSFADVREDPSRKVSAGRELTYPADGTGGFKGYSLSEVEINPNFLMQRLVRTNRRAATEREKESAGCTLSSGKSLTCDRGLNDTGFPGARVRVKAPGRLAVTWGEVLKENGDARAMGDCCDIVVWDFDRPGVYDVASFEPYTMRYVEFNVLSGEMELSNLHFRSYKNATAKRAAFRASDPDLEEIFNAAKETFRQNAVDVFSDCPSRERAGWNCDAFFTAPASTLLTGNTDLERVFEENLALPAGFEDIPEGMLPMCYPSDHRDRVFIPNWAMWFVLESGEYLRRSGDRAMIGKLRPRFEKIVEYLWNFRNSDGLLEKLPSWVFVEWSRCNRLVRDVNYPSNMTWADVLDEMDRLSGRPDLAAESKRVRETIRKQAWNGNWFCDNAMRQPDGSLKLSGECTETCQYYAFFHRVATPETHAVLWETLLTEFGPKRYDPKDRSKLLAHPEIWPSNAFIGNYLRLKLLEREGLGQQILAETKGYFKYMADRTGTLWENDTTCASCCHGFASYAAVLLVRSVLGVEKVDIANRTVTVRNTDADLDFCEAELPTPDGMLSVGWRKVGGEKKRKMSAPEGWRLIER